MQDPDESDGPAAQRRNPTRRCRPRVAVRRAQGPATCTYCRPYSAGRGAPPRMESRSAVVIRRAGAAGVVIAAGRGRASVALTGVAVGPYTQCASRAALAEQAEIFCSGPPDRQCGSPHARAPWVPLRGCVERAGAAAAGGGSAGGGRWVGGGCGGGAEATVAAVGGAGPGSAGPGTRAGCGA